LDKQAGLDKEADKSDQARLKKQADKWGQSSWSKTRPCWHHTRHAQSLAPDGGSARL